VCLPVSILKEFMDGTPLSLIAVLLELPWCHVRSLESNSGGRSGLQTMRVLSISHYALPLNCNSLKFAGLELFTLSFETICNPCACMLSFLAYLFTKCLNLMELSRGRSYCDCLRKSTSAFTSTVILLNLLRCYVLVSFGKGE
jgi:hypothetical protein